MATGVLKSFKLDQGIVMVKLDGRSPDVALRVCGSDKRTVANLPPGQKIRFDFSCTRGGQVYAIDVMPDPTVPQQKTSKAANRAFVKSDRDLQHCRCRMSPCEHANLEELLAAPIIRRLMERDGVDPQAVRALVQSIARAAAKPR
jgi:cold shock CspA family protein